MLNLPEERDLIGKLPLFTISSLKYTPLAFFKFSVLFVVTLNKITNLHPRDTCGNVNTRTRTRDR